MLYDCNRIQFQNMTKSIILSFLFVLYFFTAFSQPNPQFVKECRISSGIGFGGATSNAKSSGREVWLQLDYTFIKNVSIAMEFENMRYTLQGHYPTLPENLNVINVRRNNFSLLFKYHIETNLPLKVAVASGGTYIVKSSDYYYESGNATQDLRWNVSTIDDYEVPLLLEVRYPIWKIIDIQARVKGSLNTQQRSTYSSGIALSIRL